MRDNKGKQGQRGAAALVPAEDKSRSQKKRESSALQKKGEELAALGPGTWKLLPLPELLAEALRELQGMKNHEARRRQMQYIGRLMRETDEESMQALLCALDAYSK